MEATGNQFLAQRKASAVLKQLLIKKYDKKAL